MLVATTKQEASLLAMLGVLLEATEAAAGALESETS